MHYLSSLSNTALELLKRQFSRKMILSTRVASSIIRRLHSQRPNFKGRIPSGAFLAPLIRSGEVIFSHPLDDESDYRRFLKEDLPKEFIEDIPKDCQIEDRLVEMMNYNIPLPHPCWSFGPELIYLKAVPKDQQTPEGRSRARILRACIELRHTSVALLDDIMDESPSRQGKPTWRHAAPNGLSEALCGGMWMDQMLYYLLKKHFQNTRYYTEMLNAVIQMDFERLVGSMMDVCGQGKSKDKSVEAALHITKYKAGSVISMQAGIGMLNVGIHDTVLQKKVEEIYSIMGELVQSWDDFCDYYCTPEQTGKPSLDIVNGGITWASSTAQSLFNDEQKKLFLKCYGSNDPSKHETVRKLYDAVDIPGAYIKYIKQRSVDCQRIINDLHHPGMEKACQSLLDWMVGDC